MWKNGRIPFSLWLGVWALLLPSGCSLPEALGFHPLCPSVACSSPPPPTEPVVASSSPAGVDVSQPLTLAMHEAPAESVANLSQHLAEANDDRKVVAARLLELNDQLRAKDEALQAVSREIEGARADMAAARAELETLRRETVVLRDRLRRVDKDASDLLEQLLKALEQALKNPSEPDGRGEALKP